MEITTSPNVNAGSIWLDKLVTGHTLMLDDNVIVTLDGDRLTSVEILNLSSWGDPFDEAAAKRVLTWVHEQLAARSHD